MQSESFASHNWFVKQGLLWCFPTQKIICDHTWGVYKKPFCVFNYEQSAIIAIILSWEIQFLIFWHLFIILSYNLNDLNQDAHFILWKIFAERIHIEYEGVVAKVYIAFFIVYCLRQVCKYCQSPVFWIFLIYRNYHKFAIFAFLDLFNSRLMGLCTFWKDQIIFPPIIYLDPNNFNVFPYILRW